MMEMDTERENTDIRMEMDRILRECYTPKPLPVQSPEGLSNEVHAINSLKTKIPLKGKSISPANVSVIVENGTSSSTADTPDSASSSTSRKSAPSKGKDMKTLQLLKSLEISVNPVKKVDTSFTTPKTTKVKAGGGKPKNLSTSSASTSVVTKRKRVSKTPVTAKKKVAEVVEPVVENQAGEFIVEAIRNKKEQKGTTYFFIKWLGYPEYDNTWEPIKHLSGCRAMVEAFLRDHESKELENGNKSAKKRESQSARGSSSRSKSRTKRPKTETAEKRGNGKGKEMYDDVESDHIKSSDEDFEYNEAIAREKTRSYIEFDVATRLPRDRSPKKIIHVTVLDGKITYLVQWKNDCNDDREEEVSSENSSMVDGSLFRFQYPHMIIKFYESRLHRIDPISDELLEERACAAMVSEKERETNTEVGNDSSDDDDMIDKDVGNPIAELIDKFGLPMNLDSSSSSGSESESDPD